MGPGSAAPRPWSGCSMGPEEMPVETRRGCCTSLQACAGYFECMARGAGKWSPLWKPRPGLAAGTALATSRPQPPLSPQ